MKRRDGYVLVRNPFNVHQIIRIDLNPDVIDCIVFWSKNPRPMMNRLDKLKNYKYYFQFTLNSYDDTLEVNVPQKKFIIDTFIKLSNMVGKDKVIWRYDPIILTDIFNKQYHYRWFEYLAERLKDCTNKCVISFLDLYKKTESNLKNIKLEPIDFDDMIEIASEFSKIASKYGLVIETCSEVIDLSNLGINHGKCIDNNLISKIVGEKININKNPNQRESCGCVKSIDIGAYNTCKHQCLYCYANFNKTLVNNSKNLHSPNSPLLFGELEENDKVTHKKMESYLRGQMSFIKD